MVRVLRRQRLGHPGGDLIHQVVRLPRVQQAGEAAHVAVPRRLALLLNLLVPVVSHTGLPVYCGTGGGDDDMETPLVAAGLRRVAALEAGVRW